MVKTLTIRDSVYKKLVARKGKGESFSEFFERLLAGADSRSAASCQAAGFCRAQGFQSGDAVRNRRQEK